MTTGAAMTSTAASHRRTPRLARNQYPPATTAQPPTTAKMTSVRLRHPATAMGRATAASVRANEARASQRRAVIVIRCPPIRQSRVLNHPPGAPAARDTARLPPGHFTIPLPAY